MAVSVNWLGTNVFIYLVVCCSVMGSVPLGWKQLKSWTFAMTRADFAFILLFIGKMRSGCFGLSQLGKQSLLLRSVFALKKTILVPKHVLTQLGMCTQTLITGVSEGLMAKITWWRYFVLCRLALACGLWSDERRLVSSTIQHLLWGCMELCIKCNGAAEPWRLSPSVRGLVV